MLGTLVCVCVCVPTPHTNRHTHTHPPTHAHPTHYAYKNIVSNFFHSLTHELTLSLAHTQSLLPSNRIHAHAHDSTCPGRRLENEQMHCRKLLKALRPMDVGYRVSWLASGRLFSTKSGRNRGDGSRESGEPVVLYKVMQTCLRCRHAYVGCHNFSVCVCMHV
jgi:hypothetical protein